MRDNEFFMFNFNQRKPKDWFDPIIFTRPVDIEAFKNYECSPATLMDGFRGEAFGLCDEDAEAHSYRTIAQMQSLIAGIAGANASMQVLPQIGK